MTSTYSENFSFFSFVRIYHHYFNNSRNGRRRKVDEIYIGWEPQVRLEVMKAGDQITNVRSTIALNVDAALLGAGLC